MLKLWGMVCIAFASVMAGFAASSFRRRRLTYLEDMLSSMAEFLTEVEVAAHPIPWAIEACGIGSAKNVLCGKEKAPSAEDQRSLECFLLGLSAETPEGQVANAHVYEERLKRAEKQERERYLKEEKLFRGGAFLFGMLLIVILL